MRLGLVVLVVGIGLAGPAYARGPQLGMSVEEYRKTCGEMRIRDIYGHSIADCKSRPREYAEFVGGRLTYIGDQYSIAGNVQADACGPMPEQACLNTLRQAFAEDESTKVASWEADRRKIWRDTAEAIARGLNNGASSAPSVLSDRSITGDAPFCVVLRYGTQCRFYNLSSCQESARASDGACVVRP